MRGEERQVGGGNGEVDEAPDWDGMMSVVGGGRSRATVNSIQGERERRRRRRGDGGIIKGRVVESSVRAGKRGASLAVMMVQIMKVLGGNGGGNGWWLWWWSGRWKRSRGPNSVARFHIPHASTPPHSRIPWFVRPSRQLAVRR